MSRIIHPRRLATLVAVVVALVVAWLLLASHGVVGPRPDGAGCSVPSPQPTPPAPQVACAVRGSGGQGR